MIKSTVVILFLAICLSAQSGNYQVEKSVIAAGGAASSGGAYSLEATAGQAVAGGPLSGGGFQMFSGFWTPAPLFPTAAPVTISGRVTDRYGRGISDAVISITDQHGAVKATRSNPMGFFLLSGVASGETYLLRASARRIMLADPQRLISVVDDLSEINFAEQDPR